MDCTYCWSSMDDTVTDATTHPSCELFAGGWKPPLAPPSSSLWVVAKAPTNQPYPCRCNPRRKGANCNWERCPCWGRLPEPHLPRACCTWHPNNPWRVASQRRMSDLTQNTQSSRLDAVESTRPAPPRDGRQSQTLPSVPWNKPATIPAPSEPDPDEPDVAPREPDCRCPTPWDGKPTAKGVHCPVCHLNFASAMACGLHRPDPLRPCRNPRLVVDVDTGKPLLVSMGLGGTQVWMAVNKSSYQPGRYEPPLSQLPWLRLAPPEPEVDPAELWSIPC